MNIMNKNYEIFTESAQYYDLIYKDATRIDYKKSFDDFLILANKLGVQLTNFLDYGCGTGTHAILFAQNDIKVTGIDLSEKQISFANEKIQTLGLISKVSFHVGNMINFIISEKFDAAASFFSSFCYLLSDQDVLTFLNNAYSMINPGGFLMFEFWNSFAIKPDSQHFLIIDEEEETIYRFNKTFFDMQTGIATMPMSHLIIKDDKVVSEFTETHNLRTYTIPLLKSLINQTKWQLYDIYSNYYNLPEKEKQPKLSDFRLYAVLKK